MLMDTSPSTPVAPNEQNGPLQQHMLPTPTTGVPVQPTPSIRAPKHFLAAFFLSFFLGIFGADRFYLGYYGQGVLKLLTLGWFGIGALVDLGIIMGGGMRTAAGQPLAGYDEYKGTAKSTIKWLTIGGLGAAVVVVLSCVLAFQFMVSSGLLNTFNTGLNVESGGALSLPGMSQSQNSSVQQYQNLLKTLQ